MAIGENSWQNMILIILLNNVLIMNVIYGVKNDSHLGQIVVFAWPLIFVKCTQVDSTLQGVNSISVRLLKGEPIQCFTCGCTLRSVQCIFQSAYTWIYDKHWSIYQYIHQQVFSGVPVVPIRTTATFITGTPTEYFKVVFGLLWCVLMKLYTLGVWKEC